MVFYVSDICNGSNKVDGHTAMKRAYLPRLRFDLLDCISVTT